jgi:hypothetical protein
MMKEKGGVFDKSKIGATDKSDDAKKEDQTSALPKLSFSYHIIKARYIQRLIIGLQSALFNEENKNRIMRYLIDEK